MRACLHPDQSLSAKTQKSLSNASSLGLGCLRFSAASYWRRTILKKESAMSAEEAKHRTYQEYDVVCHARGAIAFRLWRATLYPVEITSGQNFGEGHHSPPEPCPPISTQVQSPRTNSTWTGCCGKIGSPFSHSPRSGEQSFHGKNASALSAPVTSANLGSDSRPVERMKPHLGATVCPASSLRPRLRSESMSKNFSSGSHLLPIAKNLSRSR
jgi:hypothetical protein